MEPSVLCEGSLFYAQYKEDKTEWKYPIWWGQAPKVLYTFLENCDFGDATIVPFCTSGSSGINGSLDDLHALAPEATWMDGQRFSSEVSQDEVAQWVDGLGLDL
ncbi:hypothetical protein H6B51_01765 [Pseudoflavonifractor phocaeensis]|nr:flavodoxin [Pseudoflavonifractor phocaeensis]MBM6924660.1 hypothetical protein [Pseudoflavonifractor phocaeensis]